MNSEYIAKVIERNRTEDKLRGNHIPYMFMLVKQSERDKIQRSNKIGWELYLKWIDLCQECKELEK